MSSQKYKKSSHGADNMAGKQEKAHQEIYKKSLLQVLHENFKIAERVTYVHRLIYIGEHSFNSVAEKGIHEVFEKIIKSINDHYYDEKLTGYLLYYNRYFCHVIEGSEESLIKHLKLIIQNENITNKLGRLKLLIAYHHINQEEEKVSNDGVSDENVHSAESNITNQTVNVFGHEMSSITNYLPEFSILEFLLESPHTQDLRKYLELYGEVSYLDSYEDLVWPVPCDFVPMDVFDKEQDPVTDLTITL